MRRHFLTIDGHHYFLPEDTDIDALSDEIAAAARSGGKMIDAPIAGSKTVRFLSSPGAPIIIESVDVPDDTPDHLITSALDDGASSAGYADEL